MSNNVATYLLGGILGCGLIIGGMFAVPYYNVWQQEMEGKAALAKAEQDRQIQIASAKANLEAEKLNAEAEVERAKGMAQAIEIENNKLTPNYIKYLWVRYQKDNTGKTIIYVPSGEMGLPTLEATRLVNP